MVTKKLKERTEVLDNRLKKSHSSTSYTSTLRSNPSDLEEVRNVLEIASKILPSNRIYFENMIEKVGFSNFYISDTSMFLNKF